MSVESVIARRLGPLVVLDVVDGPAQRACYGFVAGARERTLLISFRRNEEPSDDWIYDDGAYVTGSALGWRFHAERAKRGVSLLDLACTELSPAERETLAFAALSIARLEQWRPPEWQPRLSGDVLVGVDGKLADAWPTPAPLAGRRRWRPGLARHGAAAMIAACLVGEDAYPAALDAARKLANGNADAIALRSNRSALLVELISVLLQPGSSRGPHLVAQLQQELPAPDAVANLLAAHPVARWPPPLDDVDVDALPSYERAAPISLEDTFALCGDFVVYGATREVDGPRRAFPVAGPFRDLVLVHRQTEAELRSLVDPWGTPFEIHETSTSLVAVRPAAPCALNVYSVQVALLAARAIALTAPIRTPSQLALSLTNDGRVCADMFEPIQPGSDWSKTPAEWRDAWARELTRIALEGWPSTERLDEVLGAIEEGVDVDISSDAILDGKLREVLRVLTGDEPWPRIRARLLAIDVAPLAVDEDAEQRARISFVERERARIVAVCRGASARAPAPG